jgi:nucleotide-binding universal stress UspA family protein
MRHVGSTHHVRGTSVAALIDMSSQISPVVVGYDFSQSGRAALHRAVTLAARAPFHVLHVVCVVDPKEAIPSLPSYNGVDYMYAARVQEALASETQQELDRADVHGSVHFFVHARIGKAADEILALAEEVGADMIIVGSKRMTGLERLILGSTSERVMREAGCTVEIARSKQYPEVELMPIEPVDTVHTYVPPHRYTYEDHRVNLRPAEWPLY